AGTVHFTSSDAQAALPADYTYTASDAGLHTFSATLNTGGSQSLTAADAAGGFSSTQSGITVNANTVTNLGVSSPSTSTAGSPFSLTVRAQDSNNQPVGAYTGTVHFTSSDTQAVLPADYTFTAADAGVHTFTVTLKTAGNSSVTVTDTASSSLTSSVTVAVSPAAASSLIVAGYPSPTIVGSPHTFTVTAMDAYGNVATGFTGLVSFTSSDPQAVLPANYTYTTADAGVHTFIATFKTPGTQSLTATDPPSVTPPFSGTQTGITVMSSAQPSGLVAAFPVNEWSG